ncbi:MAG: hypothetical protein V7785_10410 [Bermanella sp.]
MNASEFTGLSLRLGEKYLLDIGFQFNAGNWHFLNDEYQLSFILGKDKNASHFNVKYLTVALRHIGFNWDDAIPMKLLSDIDKASPIQISPFKLKQYYESGFSSDEWIYTNSFQTPRHENVYFPIYYGGKKQKGLLNALFGKEEKQARSAHSIETFGAELISEKETTKLMEAAFRNIADYGVQWANLMTPVKILYQLEQYNSDWWVEKEWIKAYQLNITKPSTG